LPERAEGLSELLPARAATATRARRITPATTYILLRAASLELRETHGGKGGTGAMIAVQSQFTDAFPGPTSTAWKQFESAPSFQVSISRNKSHSRCTSISPSGCLAVSGTAAISVPGPRLSRLHRRCKRQPCTQPGTRSVQLRQRVAVGPKSCRVAQKDGMKLVDGLRLTVETCPRRDGRDCSCPSCNELTSPMETARSK